MRQVILGLPHSTFKIFFHLINFKKFLKTGWCGGGGILPYLKFLVRYEIKHKKIYFISTHAKVITINCGLLERLALAITCQQDNPVFLQYEWKQPGCKEALSGS